MKRVVVFGTFDVLHPGHVWFLRQARRYGDELVVVVARDAKVRREKRVPVFNEKERLEMVASLNMVSRAFLGDPVGRWTMIKKLKPDTICVGYDQRFDHRGVQMQISRLKKRVRLVRLRARNPHRYKSSKLHP